MPARTKHDRDEVTRYPRHLYADLTDPEYRAIIDLAEDDGMSIKTWVERAVRGRIKAEQRLKAERERLDALETGEQE